jgi:GT2 family glycosyltransferase
VSPDRPLVSVVFLAFNRREQLSTSLEKVLGELAWPADRLEVVVVDNASTDGTAEHVRERFPQVQLIRNPVNVGVSGWNVGLSTSRGDWCLLLDDDCYVTGDALERAVRAAQDDEADLVTFHVASSEVEGYRFNEEYRSGLFAFWGCAALVSRRAVEALHGYDPNIFFWGNELDFTMRLLDAGMRHLWLPEVVAVHMKGPTNPDKRFMLRPMQINGRHWAYIAGKALRPRDAAAALLSHLWTVSYTAVFEDRQAVGAIRPILAGFLDGLRHRQPVRPEVSRAYREHCRELANPLKWARRPGLADRDEAIEAFFERRPAYYPTDRAALTL